MQDEDTQIQTQQLGIAQYLLELRRNGLGVTVKADPVRRGHVIEQHANAQDRHHPGHPEEPWQAQYRFYRRARDHGQREGHADADADDRHGLGALLFTGQIGRERKHRRGDGAEALQRAAHDDAPDAIGAGGHGAARGEYQQPDDDDLLAADPVREPAKGDLKDCLGEAVDADGQPREHGGVPGVEVRVQAEYRKNHEQTEHTQREYAGQRYAGASLGGGHGGAGLGGR